MYVTLKAARQHLNIDDFFEDDDEYIVSLIETAEKATEHRLNRPLKKMIDPATGELKANVRHAILLLVGTLYNQREATAEKAVKEVDLGFTFLTDVDRKFPI